MVQAVQVAAPSAGECVPARHWVHTVLEDPPVEPKKVPLMQGVQAVAAEDVE